MQMGRRCLFGVFSSSECEISVVILFHEMWQPIWAVRLWPKFWKKKRTLNESSKETPTQILRFDFFSSLSLADRQTRHVFFLCTFIAFDAAVAILGRTCHCSLTFAFVLFGSQKPNFPYAIPCIKSIFIWRMCVWVSSRQETMCLPRRVHYVCNKNVPEKWEMWRSKETKIHRQNRNVFFSFSFEAQK